MRMEAIEWGQKWYGKQFDISPEECVVRPIVPEDLEKTNWDWAVGDNVIENQDAVIILEGIFAGYPLSVQLYNHSFVRIAVLTTGSPMIWPIALLPHQRISLRIGDLYRSPSIKRGIPAMHHFALTGVAIEEPGRTVSPEGFGTMVRL